MSAIVNRYADKVEAREITVDQVPKLWRAKVVEELEHRQQVELVPVEEIVKE